MHTCWASTADVRMGLATWRTLGVECLPDTQPYGIIEIGEGHAAMCFGDGIQYTTGCTFGKGNIRKQPYGKLAFTLIEKASGRAVHVSYKPMLQKQISATPFTQKCAAGIYPNEIPEDEVMEPVNLIWDAEDVAAASTGCSPGPASRYDLTRTGRRSHRWTKGGVAGGAAVGAQAQVIRAWLSGWGPGSDVRELSNLWRDARRYGRSQDRRKAWGMMAAAGVDGPPVRRGGHLGPPERSAQADRVAHACQDGLVGQRWQNAMVHAVITRGW